MDKQEYWKNRKAGKRGQGEIIKPILVEGKKPSHLVQMGPSMQLVNRATARKMGIRKRND